MHVQLERLTTLAAIDAAAWNALAGDSPFLKHEFLRALEQSGCVGPRDDLATVLPRRARRAWARRRAATLY